MWMTKATARLIERERVCRVATAGGRGMPHLVPVCQALAGGKIYFASGNDGRKAHLKGVMVQGRARLIPRGTKLGVEFLWGVVPYPAVSERFLAFHPKRVAEFAAGNPVVWYKDFLEGVVA